MRCSLCLYSVVLATVALQAGGCAGPQSGPAGSGTEAATLEVVGEISTLNQGPGNLTVAPDGTLVLSLHQFFAPDLRVVQFKDNAVTPVAGTEKIDAVLGLQFDRQGTLWLLDNGLRTQQPPTLLSRAPNATAFTGIDLSPVTPKNAFVNDLAVDRTHGAVYIADPAGGTNAAIIVVDIASGKLRRVLEGHTSVIPEDGDLIIDGEPVEIAQPDGTRVRPKIGINPIALDAQDDWLYFGPMHGTALYRVKTEDLRNEALGKTALASKVERFAQKPICDGISIDTAGNIYLGDLANNAIGVIDAQGKYQILHQDPRLSWIDAFSFGPDGRLYTLANQLHRSAVLHGGERTVKPPYQLFRLTPLAPGVPGR